MMENKDYMTLDAPEFIARCMWELATNEEYSCGKFELDTQLWLKAHGVGTEKLWKKLEAQKFEAQRSLKLCIEAIMNMQRAKAGQARWKKLSKEERSAIARKASQARSNKKV